ncbi:hypothetical protein BDW42DRAFT_167002 [Aspergillus taichungensis]|uniref:Uncharacterized protein n=1 Tax=Aspergillus taichungensis TaxID=482145 RepID=A0A2J5HY76_9EURO|nr:hypothetical protein BDW42DRAFT_167002 [Aspergillus taichungensis]
MQVAQILSDLTSLQVCDHHDALALVTVNDRIPRAHAAEEIASPAKSASIDPARQTVHDDLRRATELVELHYEIKARHADGMVDDDLARARAEVDRVLMEMEEDAW